MELGTFGAVLKFAMELEEKAISFYEEVRNKSSKSDHFTTLVQRGQKRLKILERVRRENTTEMILEPITGLDPDAYTPEISIPEGSDDKAIQSIAIALEKKLQEFYTDAAVKVEFLIEAAYSLEALADENEGALQNLSEL
jgi:hypothetical protein